MIYAELWKRELAKKGKKSEEEEIQKKLKNDERNTILAWQKSLNDQVKQEEINKTQQEKLMLVLFFLLALTNMKIKIQKDQWKLEQQQQKEIERQQAELNKQLNQEIYENNAQQRALRDALEIAEKEADKDIIKSIIYKEKILDQLEQDAKV